MEEAARRSGATIVNAASNSRTLTVSGVMVIAGSHLAIHTRPEFGYAAVDLFTSAKI